MVLVGLWSRERSSPPAWRPGLKKSLVMSIDDRPEKIAVRLMPATHSHLGQIAQNFEVLDSIKRLDNIAASHERCIDGLEDTH